MSDKELNRFLADIESDASLNQAVQALRPAGDADNRVGAEALIAFAREGLGPVKTPKRVEFVDSLPRTNAGKVSRAELRRPFWAGAGRAI